MEPLAARLARGEEAAFAELYDACADRLHRYLRLQLGNADVASDVIQAAFLRAVRSRKRFRNVENPVAYMFQIARNEASRLKSRNRARPADRAESTECMGASVGASIEDIEAATAALARLDPAERELVELKLYAGLTFREIAKVTGEPPATIATRYRRALESLRPWLERQVR